MPDAHRPDRWRLFGAIGQAFVTTFHLNATRPLPEQTGYRWSIKLDRHKHRLWVVGYVPYDMTAQAYLDPFNRGLQAFRAAAPLRRRKVADEARVV